MTDDPDELRYQRELEKRNPERLVDAIESLETVVRQNFNTGLGILWLIALLLAMVLWRLW